MEVNFTLAVSALSKEDLSVGG